MTKDDYLLICKSCHTHWYPKTYARKDVRGGNCPDCGYKGTPFTGNYSRKCWKDGLMVINPTPLGKYGITRKSNNRLTDIFKRKLK